MICFSIYLFFI